ncbi:TPA: hypothetical protein NU789_003189 [Acinetobacter baumannii]|uniref:hypothetical protein n=1 Tax=Acinetobacter baumannii TaxID=470 RepID=UPI0010FCEA5B|nr:hypothetical protein [Acinetobacter baumannii]MDA4921856.1 hypothetical protein [Acinetobacter baumannii]MDT1779763.1 hypothetical protein [Acinetobacter baumannii]TLT20423.1 hypothetical protein FD872_19480 [Acinetobacter baumannii]TLT69611.1 hypothetical protein FD891_18140 [Acinetobacter baumannii]TLT78620.1 hypothetical protein FD881_18000 [Acinetobacter baumannii]
MAYDCVKYLIVDEVQTYVCQEIQAQAENPSQYVFEISQAQANELMIFAASCFAITFVVQRIKSLLI